LSCRTRRLKRLPFALCSSGLPLYYSFSSVFNVIQFQWNLIVRTWQWPYSLHNPTQPFNIICVILWWLISVQRFYYSIMLPLVASFAAFFMHSCLWREQFPSLWETSCPIVLLMPACPVCHPACPASLLCSFHCYEKLNGHKSC